MQLVSYNISLVASYIALNWISDTDIFENISSAVKKERLQPVQDTIQVSCFHYSYGTQLYWLIDTTKAPIRLILTRHISNADYLAGTGRSIQQGKLSREAKVIV